MKDAESTLNWTRGSEALEEAAKAVGWDAGGFDPDRSPAARDFLRRNARTLERFVEDETARDRSDRHGAACLALAMIASEAGFRPGPAYAAVAEMTLENAAWDGTDERTDREIATFKRSLSDDGAPSRLSADAAARLTAAVPHLPASLNVASTLRPGASSRIRTDSPLFWNWDDGARTAAAAFADTRPTAWISPFASRTDLRALAVGEAFAEAGLPASESFRRNLAVSAGRDPHPKAGGAGREAAVAGLLRDGTPIRGTDTPKEAAPA